MWRFDFYKKKTDYLSVWLSVVVWFPGMHSLAKSTMVVLVALVILAIVLHDGQRGVPSGENCLLLLNVVESRPLSFASPEQVKP